MSRAGAERSDSPGGRRPLEDRTTGGYAEILKALSNPARLRLVNILAGGEHTVGDLCELSGLKQSLVSQQLKNLRLNDIVDRRKEVSRVYYSLKERNVISILDCLGRCSCGRAE